MAEGAEGAPLQLRQHPKRARLPRKQAQAQLQRRRRQQDMARRGPPALQLLNRAV